MTSTAVRFLAIFLVALTLAPTGAHLLELPHKIGMPADSYRIVQTIYRGWAFAGIVLIAAVLATLWLTVVQKAAQTGFAPALIAFLCMAAMLVIFFVFTFPVNQATANWTVLPGNWEALRSRWEYSHAVSGLLNIVALVAVILSSLARKP
jgi:hypothetical protein